MDFTFPFTSLLSARSFCNRIQKLNARFLRTYSSRYLGMNDKQIEDLPIPYFCISCNLSPLTEQIHTEGTLWLAMRASSSLPLIFPPVVYGSEGSLLVDGAFMNNLPVDVMKGKFSANYIVAGEPSIYDYFNGIS